MVDTEKLLKSLLKVGMKAAVPFVGGVIATAVEEWGSLLLGHQAERKARALHDRLLGKVRDCAEALATGERIAPERMEYVIPNVEAILRLHGLRPEDWSDVNFDAHEATRIVLDRAVGSFMMLDDNDKALCRLLIEAFHTAFLENRDALLRTESAFRRAVLNRLDALPKAMMHYSSETTEAALRLAAQALIEIPSREWNPDRSPPGALLRADYGIVQFHGRVMELANIHAWCTKDAAVGVRLYTGAGGMGKTRLFIELCKQLQDRGWLAGFLDNRAISASPEIWSEIFHQSARLFLVVDYAETRRGEMISLFREIPKTEEGRVRIVLLARDQKGEWWDELKAERHGVGDLLSGPATAQCSLKPLAMETLDRKESYEKAVMSFSDILGNSARADLPDDIQADYFKQVLLLHMRALAAIDGVQIKGEQGILNYILSRERRFWSENASVKGLSKLLEPGMAQAMATITLGGGVQTQSDALSVLERIPLLKNQAQSVLNGVSTLLHETYPGEKWIEPLLPDLLAEHLVQVELDDDAESLFEIVLGEKKVWT